MSKTNTPLVPVELTDAVKTASDACNRNNAEITKLVGKVTVLEDEIEQLYETLAHAKQMKAAALEAHAVDSITDKELEAARRHQIDVATKLTEAEELLAAVTRAVRNTQQSVAQLAQRKLSAEKKVWKHLADMYQEQMQSQAGETFRRFEICQRKIGIDLQLSPFRTIPPSLLMAETKQFEAEIFGTLTKGA